MCCRVRSMLNAAAADDVTIWATKNMGNFVLVIGKCAPLLEWPWTLLCYDFTCAGAGAQNFRIFSLSLSHFLHWSCGGPFLTIVAIYIHQLLFIEFDADFLFVCLWQHARCATCDEHIIAIRYARSFTHSTWTSCIYWEWVKKTIHNSAKFSFIEFKMQCVCLTHFLPFLFIRNDDDLIYIENRTLSKMIFTFTHQLLNRFKWMPVFVLIVKCLTHAINFQ